MPCHHTQTSARVVKHRQRAAAAADNNHVLPAKCIRLQLRDEVKLVELGGEGRGGGGVCTTHRQRAHAAAPDSASEAEATKTQVPEQRQTWCES
jgi:hypothetical protein